MDNAQSRINIFAGSWWDRHQPDSQVFLNTTPMWNNAVFYTVSLYVAISRNITPTLNKDVLYCEKTNSGVNLSV